MSQKVVFNFMIEKYYFVFLLVIFCIRIINFYIHILSNQILNIHILNIHI